MLRNCCTGRGFWLLFSIAAFAGLVFVIFHTPGSQIYSFSFSELYSKLRSNKIYKGFRGHPKFNKYVFAAQSHGHGKYRVHQQPQRGSTVHANTNDNKEKHDKSHTNHPTSHQQQKKVKLFESTVTPSPKNHHIHHRQGNNRNNRTSQKFTKTNTPRKVSCFLFATIYNINTSVYNNQMVTKTNLGPSTQML